MQKTMLYILIVFIIEYYFLYKYDNQNLMF